MKAVFIKARGSAKVGDAVEIEAKDFEALEEMGFVVSPKTYATLQAQHEAGKQSIIKAVAAKKTAGLIEAKNNDIEAGYLNRFESGTPADALIEIIEATYKPVATVNKLQTRETDGSGTGTARIDAVEEGFRDTAIGYLKASEPFIAARKNGGIIAKCNRNEVELKNVGDLSLKRSRIMAKLVDMIKGGADYDFADVVKAADYVDPSGSATVGVGTLNTDLLLAFNLGYLENQLIMLDDITTDISSQPVQFNQTALTRYLRVPGFQIKTTSYPWNTSATTGSAVDVNVKMDKYIGIPLSWNQYMLGATTRNLPNEFKTPQLYGIGEAFIYYLVNAIVNGTTRIAYDGTTTSTIKPNAMPDGVTAGKAFNIANPTLATFTGALPTAMDLAKFPGGDEGDADPALRFAWVHSTVYSSLAQDTNLLLNQTIQGLGNKINPNLMATGRLNKLGNISLRKSQLMSDQLSLTSDGNTPINYTVSVGNYTNATTLGVAGTRSGLVFTSRLPVDYTKVMPDVPQTAAIEVVTSPRLGVQIVVVKYLDHNYETANMRASAMFGIAIGDERQLMLLNVK